MSRKRKVFILAAAVCLLLLLGGISWAGDHMKGTFTEEDVRMAEDTVRKYAIQCYALEGSYPEKIDYLEDNYMLTLNREEYVYHYVFIGANMMPDITVFPIE
ncbi:MAG: hypothetical protein IJ070_03035 [Firmicutes bacterium]|nr:hypothetical protein [Bacillota bacterium]MBQ9707813.1 hypothetical protein [Bacillota bacterium]